MRFTSLMASVTLAATLPCAAFAQEKAAAKAPAPNPQIERGRDGFGPVRDSSTWRACPRPTG